MRSTGDPSYAVRLDSVSKEYRSGRSAVRALDAVTAGFPRGTFTAVMGPSGSGKSTFLNCAAGLDRPTSGRVVLGDTELSGRSETELTELRRDRIGFVFQMGQTVLMVTHDPVATSFADSVVFLADGRLAGELARPTPDLVAARMTHLGEW